MQDMNISFVSPLRPSEITCITLTKLKSLNRFLGERGENTVMARKMEVMKKIE